MKPCHKFLFTGALTFGALFFGAPPFEGTQLPGGVFFFAVNIAFAGETGTHGGNHLKDRFLLAKEFALKVLADKQCQSIFTAQQCQRMHTKLVQSGELRWFEEKDKCLRGLVKGVEQCVTANTTPGYSSPITIDIGAAERTKISFEEAVVLLVHEAGHAVGLSDDLITDQKVIQLFSTEEFRRSKGVLSNLSQSSDLDFGNGMSTQSCLKLKAALEKIYDREVVGSEGIARSGWDLINKVEEEHEKFFGDVWSALGDKGQEEIKLFLETRTSPVPDDFSLSDETIVRFNEKLYSYTEKIRDRLDEEGALQPRHEGPPAGKDIHKHSIDARYANRMVQFEICTYHYEDTNLINATRLEECSRLEFTLAWYDPKKLEVYRRIFWDGGNYRHTFIKGQRYTLWSYPTREEWALRGIGYECEKKIKEARAKNASDTVRRQR